MTLIAMLQLVISSMLIYATPLIFTSLGGTFSERAGIVNVGLEGIMVMGAFSGIVFNLTFSTTFGSATPMKQVCLDFGKSTSNVDSITGGHFFVRDWAKEHKFC